jgi:hypothetical protein
VGLVCLSVLAIGGSVGLARPGIDPVPLGLTLTALSGVGGMAGFFAAFLLRIRFWAAFGVRRTTWRWIVFGAAVGIGSFFAKGLAILAYVSLTGDHRTIQVICSKLAWGQRPT